jgi:hypothetical protein
MTILPFSPGDRVLWHGWEAEVITVRGDMVGLQRTGEDFAIVTTQAELHKHQPARLVGYDWLSAGPAGGGMADASPLAVVLPPSDCAQ